LEIRNRQSRIYGKWGNVEQCEGELKHCKASLEQQINSTNAIIDSDLDPKLFMKKIW
jgi:hypothetical protein